MICLQSRSITSWRWKSDKSLDFTTFSKVYFFIYFWLLLHCTAVVKTIKNELLWRNSAELNINYHHSTHWFSALSLFKHYKNEKAPFTICFISYSMSWNAFIDGSCACLHASGEPTAGWLVSFQQMAVMCWPHDRYRTESALFSSHLGPVLLICFTTALIEITRKAAILKPSIAALSSLTQNRGFGEGKGAAAGEGSDWFSCRNCL